ncbi:hypothetical protein AAE478_007963 [Parahypoxylon ruwenzoriense]
MQTTHDSKSNYDYWRRPGKYTASRLREESVSKLTSSYREERPYQLVSKDVVIISPKHFETLVDAPLWPPELTGRSGISTEAFLEPTPIAFKADGMKSSSSHGLVGEQIVGSAPLHEADILETPKVKERSSY